MFTDYLVGTTSSITISGTSLWGRTLDVLSGSRVVGLAVRGSSDGGVVLHGQNLLANGALEAPLVPCLVENDELLSDVDSLSALGALLSWHLGSV